MQRRFRSKPLYMAMAAGLALTLGMTSVTPVSAAPEGDHDGGRAVGLVQQAREAGARYTDVQNAIADGYVPATGCVSGDNGAMGVHYVNLGLYSDDQLDPYQPEALVYEPDRHGGMHLVALEYMVVSSAWHATHPFPPVLTGQSMELIGEPNRFAIPATYELHVWAFRHNPNGMFAAYNPKVSCANYDPVPSA